jgi:hypothetical protein
MPDEAVGENARKTLGLWYWLMPKLNNAAARRLGALLKAGCFWMITPYRKLELVHAVPQPLWDPSLDADARAVKKEIGDTAAMFSGHAILHNWSTGKVELLAAWKEWDDTSGAGPVQIDRQAFASQALVTYRADAVLKGNTELLDETEDGLRLRLEFGDTRHRQVDFRLVGTSRYEEYFPPSLRSARNGLATSLDVASSARPAAPEVEYVLPTFGWKTETKGNKLIRTRVGGGLRIYLKRPWYSSGDEEQLGVVLAQQPPDRLPPALQPYVTQAGRDPIWESALSHTALAKGDFSNCIDYKEGLPLEEVPPSRPASSNFLLRLLSRIFSRGTRHPVNVAAFEPRYNPERGLWSCDVQFDPAKLTSYYPFVRLALARYQPHSITDAHLSRVVLTDFIQLVPTRILEVIPGSDPAAGSGLPPVSVPTPGSGLPPGVGINPGLGVTPGSGLTLDTSRIINLTLTGIAPRITTWKRTEFNQGNPIVVENRVEPQAAVLIQPWTNQVEVTVESHDEGIPGDLGWKPAADPVVLSGRLSNPGTSEWVWNGTVKVPAGAKKGQYRLVVREYEILTADATAGHEIKDSSARRVVYADTVEL